MSKNKKITELLEVVPDSDQFFLVANELENYKISWTGLSEYSSIGTKSGAFTESLTLSNNPVVTGRSSDGFLSDDYISNIESRLDFNISYVYFTDFINNNGITKKIYYNKDSSPSVPFENLVLSGVVVDDASNCYAKIRWDGPPGEYMGDAYINSVKVDPATISELASYTRKFEANLDGLDFSGSNKGIANANNQDAIIDIIELTTGPSAVGFDIDDTSVVPEPGSDTGSTHLKSGDKIDLTIFYDFSNHSSIYERPSKIFVYDEGAGSGEEFTDLVFTPITPAAPDIGYQTTISVTVGSRDGTFGFSVHSENMVGLHGGKQVTSDNPFFQSIDIDNTRPTLNINSILYPASQGGIKNGESCTINYSAIGHDVVTAEALIIPPSTSQELSITLDTGASQVIAAYLSGDKNTSIDNLSIKAKRTSNGAVDEELLVINIANVAPTFTHNLPSVLKSLPGDGFAYDFTLISDQKLLIPPTLSLDTNQSPISILDVRESGTSEESNKYTLNVIDKDARGDFNFSINAVGLSGIPYVGSISNPYTIQGAETREIIVDPRSYQGGLGFLGFNVSNIERLYIEDLSQTGAGENGGVIYTYQDTLEQGDAVPEDIDIENYYTICTDQVTVFQNGDHFFNLGNYSRASNASVSDPAKFIVREDYP
jgi:hypothetical protein